MTKAERHQLVERMRALLLQRRDELSAAVRGEMEQFQGEKQHALDLDEAAGDPTDEDTPLALLEIEGNELEQIDWALQRMDQGQYGVCEECEQEIALARLKALPFATHCITCEREREVAESRLTGDYHAAGWGAHGSR